MVNFKCGPAIIKNLRGGRKRNWKRIHGKDMKSLENPIINLLSLHV